MKFDLFAKVEVREGREDCEYGKSLGICDGPIRSCSFKGLCESKWDYGNDGHYCIFKLQKDEKKPADVRTACEKANLDSLAKKLVE